ncbi:MAG: sigma-54-dependent Fis family transcriptional regulator [Myxococcales bacterium FL481]|nr:MAG: sigma-54-dependent Fis family transcriptional regulator [Myxococcales bacterium FL481]
MNAVPPPPLGGQSVLVVDDNDAIRSLLATYLSTLGCVVESAPGGSDALERMAEQTYDLVLLDLKMNDLDGLEVLKRAKPQGLARNYMMMSAQGSVGTAVDAIRLGAADFLLKPFDLPDLGDAVIRVLGRSVSATGTSDDRVAWRDRYAPRLLGQHEALLKVFLVLERIAEDNCTVLIHGESGTGKELVARALHDSSPRAEHPFIPLNCGAIPETLIESELFGHARGAFTGAQAREGRFEAANRGSLFLDEIGEMKLDVQVKLLRVLQEKEYVPVGETRPKKTDARIIAATNKNLEEMVEAERFREDLFFRLNTITIHLPALRDRASDVPLLARHFLSQSTARRRRPLSGFTDAALEALQAYRWPGNVRELQNLVERVTLLHAGEGLIDIEDLPQRIRESAATPRSSSRARARDAPAANIGPESPPVPSLSVAQPAYDSPATVSRPTPSANDSPDDIRTPAAGGTHTTAAVLLPEDGVNLKDLVESIENGLIDQALARTSRNVAAAARLLGMNRTTLVERLRRRHKDQPNENGS